MIPFAGQLIGDWLEENFTDHTVKFKEYDALNDQVELGLPPIVNEKGCTLIRKLTLTIPKYGQFNVDGISICDPTFFDALRQHITKQSEVFAPSVEQWKKDGTVPKFL